MPDPIAPVGEAFIAVAAMHTSNAPDLHVTGHISAGVIRDHPVYISENKSRVTVFAPSIPMAVQRETWSLNSFTLVEELYRGKASRVYKVGEHRWTDGAIIYNYSDRRLSISRRELQWR